ncbi:MAG: tRNA lysidine(34) synthetase TilS [Casimicrobiaceae bacterium]
MPRFASSGDESAIAAVRARVVTTVAATVDAHVGHDGRLAVALSGGRDSVVLLDALAQVATTRSLVLFAIHVHHGLSINANAWAQFCANLCRARNIPLSVCKVDVPRARGFSLEAEARRARYAALADAALEPAVSHIALAHHQDDQAETLLLQLLRGAGPHGLAAMPQTRRDPRGLLWLRPLLGVARSEIDGYAAACKLAFVDDESNLDRRHVRNALRTTALPALKAIAPQVVPILARAAAHQGEAALLLDELAAFDASTAFDGATLDRASLGGLAPHRARNLLRWFLRQHGLPAPSSARLAAMLAQLTHARPDARVRLAHGGTEIGVYHSRIVVHAPPPPAYSVPWAGQALLALPHGMLAFERTLGQGVSAERFGAAQVTVRGRGGGERLQLAPGRPRRALKAILHEAGVPEWQRRGLPLLFCGDELAAVPHLGVDVAYQASGKAPGFALRWEPNAVASGSTVLDRRD